MGKTLTRNQLKTSKFSRREISRRAKELQRYEKPESDEPRKVVKKRWQPHSEIDV